MAEASEQQVTNEPQPPQWVTRYNRPGLSKLVYRGGRYSRALGQMLEQLPGQSARGKEPVKSVMPPLARLNTDAHSDWTLGLMHSWAAVTEVLGFYQERIVNEGYLHTASEHRSVMELARTIGYELRPGLAANTTLAFTILTTRDEPVRQVFIPAGTAVQSVPAPGEKSQTFETSAGFTASSEWNALKPVLVQAVSWPVDPEQKTTAARLIGANTGLRAGETILIVGDPPGQDAWKRPWFLAALKTVQAFPDQGYTRVTWESPLAVGGNGPLNQPQAFVVRQQTGLFGYSPASVLCGSGLEASVGDRVSWSPAAIGLPQAGVNVLIGDAQGTLFAGTGQGLYRSFDQGETWQPVSVGLLPKDTHALAFDQDGHLLTGMDDAHIYQSKDGGEKWSALNGEEVPLPPVGLAKLWSRGKTPLAKTVVRSLAVYSRGSERILAAATDKGIFRSKDRSKNWLPANKDLPKTDAKTGLASVVSWSLATLGSKRKSDLYAGTDVGVFHIHESLNFGFLIAAIFTLALLIYLGPGNVQTALGILTSTLLQSTPPDGLGRQIFFLNLFALIAILFALLAPIRDSFFGKRAEISLGMPVHVLMAGSQGHLFAGTKQGLYRSNDNTPGNFWQRIGHSLVRWLLGDLVRRWQRVSLNQDIRALAVDTRGNILAATSAGAVVRSRDNGDTWESLGTDLPVKPIQAIWAQNEKVFVAGPPPKTKAESRWSSFQVERKQIDLDKIYPQLVGNSWMVLNDSVNMDCELYQISQVESAESKDPVRPGQFTRLIVDHSNGLAGYDRISAQVRIQAETLQLISDQPADPGLITFDRYVSNLKPGQKLVVSGKRLRARLLSQGGEPLKLIVGRELRPIDLESGEVYQVLRASSGSMPGTMTMWLQTRKSLVGWITIAREQIRFEPSAESDELVSEVVEISGVHEDLWKRTVVTLTAALENIFDGPTITVNGNSVHATHGKTISGELLGSSQGLAAQQRFWLKYSPLTYTSAATGSGEEGAVKIEIDGVRWQQVTSFDRLEQDRRVFMLQHDDQGNAAVLFGFGQQGTGIPFGTEQIRATYRQGLGREGNVAAESLHLLQNALPGLKAVSNPLAASGGIDPESMIEAREEAPRSVRAMQRIVSLSDYQDFAERFAGIGKAQSRLIVKGHRRWMYITIADLAGNEVAENSDLYKNLTAAIHNSRTSPTPPVLIASYKLVFFRLRAKLLIDPAYFARMAAIKKQAEDNLEDYFAFNQRKFGQPVIAAEIIKLIQDMPGMVAVELDHLYKDDQAASLNLRLEAQNARWENDGLYPAEMLMIKPIDGIELLPEIAP